MTKPKKSKKAKTYTSKLDKLSLNRKKLIFFVVIFAGIGSALLIISHAATPTASIQPETATITSPAITGTDSNASGGSYVQFKAAASGGNDPCLATLGVSNMPCASNTGVPVGTTLVAYTGPTTITSCNLTSGGANGIVNGVIDSKTISGGITVNVQNGFHDAAHPCVTIKNSMILGGVDTHYPQPLGIACASVCGPVVITDSELNIPKCTGCVAPNQGSEGLHGPNIHAWRVNVHGASNPQFGNDLQYDELHDSYLHDQYNISGDLHTAAVAINTASTAMFVTIDHNTLSCNFYASEPGSTGGCSATANIYIQRSDSHDISFTNNYFWQIGSKGSGGIYCLYTGITDHEAGSSGSFNGYNITWAHNIMDNRCYASNGGPYFTTYSASYGASHNDIVCDNHYRSDQGGGLFIADEIPSGSSCP